MEIRKSNAKAPAYPSKTALKIGAAVAAAGILLGSAAGCASGMNSCADEPRGGEEVQLSGEVAYTPENESFN